MMSKGKRCRWITLLTLFMIVRSLRAAKQPLQHDDRERED
jgi:hypothetical protein